MLLAMMGICGHTFELVKHVHYIIKFGGGVQGLGKTRVFSDRQLTELEVCQDTYRICIYSRVHI